MKWIEKRSYDTRDKSGGQFLQYSVYRLENTAIGPRPIYDEQAQLSFFVC